MTRHAAAIVVAVLVVFTPRVARAEQGGLFGPGIEIGADVGLGVKDIDPNDARVTAGPRLTIHLSPRNALLFFADAAAGRQEFGNGYWERTRIFSVGFRRMLYDNGSFGVGALAGTGLSRREFYAPSFPSVGRDGPIIVPESLGAAFHPVVSFGLNLERRLTDRFSVHSDLMLIGTSGASEFRATAGFSVPIRPYPAGGRSASTAYGPTPIGVGQTLWIRDLGGREVRGTVSDIDTARIEIVTVSGRVSFARADISRIALPDRLVNGTVTGAAIGAGSLAGFVAFLSSVLCESDNCDSAGPILLGAAYGAGFGAVAGALVDSLVDGRRVVYGSETGVQIGVAPKLTRRAAGARFELSW